MAGTAPGAQKIKLDYVIERKVYEDFVKHCSKKGLSQHVIIQQLMQKFTETGKV